MAEPQEAAPLQWQRSVTRDATWGHVAQIRHLLDHPYGYAQGTIGWYPLRDLQPCGWPEADDAPVQADLCGAARENRCG